MRDYYDYGISLSGNFQQRSEIHERNIRQKNNLDLPNCRFTEAGQRVFRLITVELKYIIICQRKSKMRIMQIFLNMILFLYM